MKKKWILSLLLILTVFISGCTSSKDYEQPSETTTTTQVAAANTPTTQLPAVKPFQVGETANNGKIAITLNKVRYATVIDEQDNEFLTAESTAGKEYAIVDVTLENLENDKTQSMSSLLMFEMRDEEGYGYDLDFMASVALDKKCDCDGDLLPRKKMRGEIPFEVPKDVKGLEFHFLFGIGETTAVFDV